MYIFDSHNQEKPTETGQLNVNGILDGILGPKMRGEGILGKV